MVGMLQLLGCDGWASGDVGQCKGQGKVLGVSGWSLRNSGAVVCYLRCVTSCRVHALHLYVVLLSYLASHAGRCCRAGLVAFEKQAARDDPQADAKATAHLAPGGYDVR